MSTTIYTNPLDPFVEHKSGSFHDEFRQWILVSMLTEELPEPVETKVPSIRMTDEMKQEQRMLHLGKKRSKQACRNISKSKTLGNHNLAKSYLLISPTGEEIFVPKGEMNIIAPKYDLDSNVLRHNATKIRKNGTPFKHKKWITQLVC
jgi:hypothetical protein|tara:strand:- start:396 stop:839 length:444 start_codon:yes stop_codon:yes gene_type:complete